MRHMVDRAAPLLVALLCVAACEGDIGTGGGGGEGGSSGSARPIEPAGSDQTCDTIGVCQGDAVTPSSGCVECAVLGNDGFAINGGACLDEYVGCFGPGGTCDEGAHPECCKFFDCLVGCPEDDPGTAADELLDCACSNNGTECLVDQEKGTCLGDEPAGGERYLAWSACLFFDVCSVSCGEMP